MAKTKKKGLAEKTRTKKKETTQKINPFEVKINRQKHDVLGRKLGKHDKGMPGVSRSKAIKKVCHIDISQHIATWALTQYKDAILPV